MAACALTKSAIKAGRPKRANGIAHQNCSIYTLTPKAIQYRVLRKNPKPNKYPNIAACLLLLAEATCAHSTDNMKIPGKK